MLNKLLILKLGFHGSLWKYKNQFREKIYSSSHDYISTISFDKYISLNYLNLKLKRYDLKARVEMMDPDLYDRKMDCFSRKFCIYKYSDVAPTWPQNSWRILQ